MLIDYIPDVRSKERAKTDNKKQKK